MTIHRFFVEKLVSEGKIKKYDDVELIKQLFKVLRLKGGQQITLFDGVNEILCELLNVNKKYIEVKGIKKIERNNELSKKITLFQSIPNRISKFEDIVRHAVELGVQRIVPIVTDRSQLNTLRKRERIEKIIIEACEQCERNFVPVLEDETSFSEILNESENGINIILEAREYDGVDFIDIKGLNNLINDNFVINVFVGPEGGFTKKEILDALNVGCVFLKLSKTILRTETASLAMLAVLSFIDQ